MNTKTDQYKKILLALDLTPACIQVGKRAVEIAQCSGAELELIHVVEYVPLDLSNDLMLAQPVELDSQVVEDARNSLATLATDLGVADALRHVEMGSTKGEIIRAANAIKADLIVVGSHGRHGLALLLGSTANAVLHGAPCDVLAVRVGKE